MIAKGPVVGPRLRRLLVAVLLLFALLAINSIYLGAVTLIEWIGDEVIQNYFYQWMFLGHLVLGLVLVIPVLVYGAIHIRNAHDHRNRRAAAIVGRPSSRGRPAASGRTAPSRSRESAPRPTSERGTDERDTG